MRAAAVAAGSRLEEGNADVEKRRLLEEARKKSTWDRTAVGRRNLSVIE